LKSIDTAAEITVLTARKNRPLFENVINAASRGGTKRPWVGRGSLATMGVGYDHGQSQAGLFRRDWL
jgi:hypothetical protein